MSTQQNKRNITTGVDQKTIALPKGTIAILIMLLLAGLAIRIYDITDLPFDFHPSRQLYTAILARGRYYQNLDTAQEWQRDMAIRVWQKEDYEPPFMDGLAAISYHLIGKEILWAPRLFSAIFWVLGGWGIFLLAREMSSDAGGLAAASFYLFLPYAVIASRSFQPDPLMTALTIFSWWFIYRWSKNGGLKWALLGGLFSGMAILVKALAVFAVAGAFLGLLLMLGIQKMLRNRNFWIMGIISILPISLYMLYGFLLEGSLGSQFSLRFFPSMWIDPVFYLKWITKIEAVTGLTFFIAGMIGWFLQSKKENKIFLLGLMVGYLVYGFIFSYYFSTHDYYHITLIPLIAMLLAPLADLVFNNLLHINPNRWLRWAAGLILAAGMLINIWNIRTVFHKVDYRGEAGYWENIGDIVGHDTSVIALTQDYGYRLEYFGWVSPAGYWPYTGDTRLRELAGLAQPDFLERFQDLIREKQFFLITDLDELDRQPQLEQALRETYPVFSEGEGFIVYDLTRNLMP